MAHSIEEAPSLEVAAAAFAERVHGGGKLPLDSPSEAFNPLGLPVALYMRLLWFGQWLFVALFAVALGSIVYNMTGTYLRDGKFGGGAVGWFYYSHTLGNAPGLLWLHSMTACALSALLCCAIVCEQRRLRRVLQRAIGGSASVSGARFTAAHFAVLVSGLETEPAAAMQSLVELCGAREVVQRVVPVENRRLVLAIRAHAAARLAHQRTVASITIAEREAAHSALAAESVVSDALASVTSTTSDAAIYAVKATAVDLQRLHDAAVTRASERATGTHSIA